MRRRKTRASLPEGEDAARERCLRLLGLRARSAGELRERLKSAGFADEVIASVLSDLGEAKLVDDEEFARSWVAGRQAAGGAGRRKLRWELRRKGISNEIIARVVDEGIDDETELRQAMAVVQGRLRGQGVEGKARARLQRLLLGRGFEHTTVDTVLRRIPEEAEHS
ncbi:MAG: regulatory protein RecX [Armatimonadota bacterium]|nr:MAG: regulatory protein RecX [Armatimonadota bacterium]